MCKNMFLRSSTLLWAGSFVVGTREIREVVELRPGV